MMRKQRIPYIPAVVTFFLAVGLFTAMSLHAQVEGLSENANNVLELARAGDEAGLQNYLEDLSPDERTAAVRELAGTLSGRQIRNSFPMILKTITMIQPTNGMDALSAAVEASGGKQAVIKSAMEGLIAGALAHPALTTEDERLAAVSRTAEAAAAAVIRYAEGDDKVDCAAAAFAVVRGGVRGIESGDEAKQRLRTVAAAMSRGGVGAASEPNRPAMARSMMLALAEIKDIDMRRAGMDGIAEGGREAGGEPAAAAMAPLQEQMESVLVVAPLPVSPELRKPVDVDEVSPF